MAGPTGDITRLLEQACGGSASALSELMPVVYDELRKLADGQMRRERGNHTLDPTALVNEAYVRLVDHEAGWDGRAHFFGTAANVMRRVLVDHARRHQAHKRGAGASREPLATAMVAFERRDTVLVDLEDALQRLAAMDSQQARIVELRFFGALTVEEIAGNLELSVSTVERRWRLARAWLLRELDSESHD